MLSCIYCKGSLEHKLVNHIVDLGDSIIIIKGVPADVCRQCGEPSFSDKVARQLEKIVNRLKNMHLEIAVSHYFEDAA